MKKITIGGEIITLIGTEVKVGDKAPSFEATKEDMSKFVFDENTLGKVIVLTSFPSIDTGICALQAKKFNHEIAKFGDKALLITISNDLPFAISRHCAAEGITNAITLSDHKNTEFGLKYGLLIDELRLLGRSVFVIDQNGVIVYKDVLDEIKQEPNYEKPLEVVKSLIG